MAVIQGAASQNWLPHSYYKKKKKKIGGWLEEEDIFKKLIIYKN